MELIRRQVITNTDEKGNKGFVQTLGILRIPGFEALTIERPWIRNLSRISCLAEGTYPYRVINQTPTSNLAQIDIHADKRTITIRVEPDYKQIKNHIMLGKRYIHQNDHLSLAEQRDALARIARSIPETGTITISRENNNQ